MPFLPPNQQRQSTEGTCSRHIKAGVQTARPHTIPALTRSAAGSFRCSIGLFCSGVGSGMNADEWATPAGGGGGGNHGNDAT